MSDYQEFSPEIEWEIITRTQKCLDESAEIPADTIKSRYDQLFSDLVQFSSQQYNCHNGDQINRILKYALKTKRPKIIWYPPLQTGCCCKNNNETITYQDIFEKFLTQKQTWTLCRLQGCYKITCNHPRC